MIVHLTFGNLRTHILNIKWESYFKSSWEFLTWNGTCIFVYGVSVSPWIGWSWI